MSSILQFALSNVLFAAALTVIAFVVTRVWKNPHVAHLMWLIVFLKLVTPPLWSIPLPAAGLAASKSPSELSSETPSPGEEAKDTDSSSRAVASWQLEGAPSEAVALGPPVEVGTEIGSPSAPLANRPAHAAAGIAAVAPAEPAESRLGWQRWLVGSWLASSLICCLLAVVRIARFQRVVRRGAPADALLGQQVRQLAQRLNLHHLPDVRVLETRMTPMVWPLARRRMLLLPRCLVDELTRTQLDTVIAHELAHLARRDEFVRCLETVVTCLYWWNPLVGIARRELHAAEEACCDALVVHLLPESRRQYGEALLRAAEIVSFGRPLPALASGMSQRRVLKRRIEMILKHKFRRRASWQARLLLLSFSVCVLPLAATVRSQENSSDKEPGTAETSEAESSADEPSGTDRLQPGQAEIGAAESSELQPIEPMQTRQVERVEVQPLVSADQMKLLTRFIAAQSRTVDREERKANSKWFRDQWTANDFPVTPAIEWMLKQDNIALASGDYIDVIDGLRFDIATIDGTRSSQEAHRSGRTDRGESTGTLRTKSQRGATHFRDVSGVGSNHVEGDAGIRLTRAPQIDFELVRSMLAAKQRELARMQPAESFQPPDENALNRLKAEVAMLELIVREFQTGPEIAATPLASEPAPSKAAGRPAYQHRPAAQSSSGDLEGAPIYNERIKRFKFRLEHIPVRDKIRIGEAFRRTYAGHDYPAIHAAWGDPQTNSIVIVAPPEADQHIRETIAEWEGQYLGIDSRQDE